MEYVIVAFRSRSETIKFYEFLKHNGLNSQVVNTPKEVGVGCGLSIKINKNAYPLVRNAIKAIGYQTFAGFFLIKSFAGKRIVKSI